MGDLVKLEDVATLIPDEDARIYQERIADLLGRRSTNFPGAQPVSFARSHLRELQQADYYLCEKTDGIRVLLYLTFMIIEGQRREACFLIDRKNHYYYIDNPHFHFPLPNGPPDSFHADTLLDGELVLDTMPNGAKVRRYLVFDCMVVDDKPLLNRTLDKRIGYCKEYVLKPYENLFRMFPQEREEQPFEVKEKKLEKAYGIEMMFKDVLPSLAHGNDGLVFTCRTSEYVTGSDPHIIKWKPPHENTIDFKMQIGRFPPLGGALTNGNIDDMRNWDYDATPEIDLLVFYGKDKRQPGLDVAGYKKFASLVVTDDEWESMKRLNQVLDGRLIECYKDDKKQWRYKREKDGSPRFRDDKTEANHISTVDSVLESIEDGVNEDDLITVSGRIKGAWKEKRKD